ncbi:hypothetical protein F4604DRAFT_1918594 [Suillus subluteus]|nr:hypothetical protein F4604DRAFT_1918594 [Suillus subluteus]
MHPPDTQPLISSTSHTNYPPGQLLQNWPIPTEKPKTTQQEQANMNTSSIMNAFGLLRSSDGPHVPGTESLQMIAQLACTEISARSLPKASTSSEHLLEKPVPPNPAPIAEMAIDDDWSFSTSLKGYPNLPTTGRQVQLDSKSLKSDSDESDEESGSSSSDDDGNDDDSSYSEENSDPDSDDDEVSDVENSHSRRAASKKKQLSTVSGKAGNVRASMTPSQHGKVTQATAPVVAPVKKARVDPQASHHNLKERGIQTPPERQQPSRSTKRTAEAAGLATQGPQEKRAETASWKQGGGSQGWGVQKLLSFQLLRGKPAFLTQWEPSVELVQGFENLEGLLNDYIFEHTNVQSRQEFCWKLIHEFLLKSEEFGAGKALVNVCIRNDELSGLEDKVPLDYSQSNAKLMQPLWSLVYETGSEEEIQHLCWELSVDFLLKQRRRR